MEYSSTRVVCLALALTMAAATAAVTPCAAQNSQQDFVNPHNAARAARPYAFLQACMQVHSVYVLFIYLLAYAYRRE